MLGVLICFCIARRFVPKVAYNDKSYIDKIALPQKSARIRLVYVQNTLFLTLRDNGRILAIKAVNSTGPCTNDTRFFATVAIVPVALFRVIAGKLVITNTVTEPDRIRYIAA